MAGETNEQLQQVLDAASAQTASAKQLTDEYAGKANEISQAVTDAIADMNEAANTATQGVSQQRASIISEVTAAAVAEADRAEAAADAANLSGGVYNDVASGVAAVTEGNYFSVPSPDDDEYLILYRHDAGSTATEIKRYPAAGVVAELVSMTRTNQAAIFGYWKSYSNPNASTYRFSNDRLYIMTETAIYFVASQVDVDVSNNQVMYIDVNNGSFQDGSGNYIPQIASVTSKAWFGSGKFVLFGAYNGIICSPIMLMSRGDLLNSKINSLTEDLAANIQQTRRANYKVVGNLSFIASDPSGSGDVVISHPDLRIFTGPNSLVPNTIQRSSKLTIPPFHALVIKFSDGLQGGVWVPKVTSNVMYSKVTYGDDGFIYDDHIVLFINNGGGQYGGELYGRPAAYEGLGDLIIPWSNCEVTFDPTTRTLAWTGDLYLLYRGGGRVRLNAGSVTFPDNDELLTCYLSIKDIADFANANPVECVKFGRYYTGSERFWFDKGQIPLFWHSSGKYGPAGGFPQPTIVNTVVNTEEKNTAPIIIQVHTPTTTVERMDVYLRDDGSYNDRYIKWRFEKVINNDINSDVWHVQRCWVVSNDLQTTIKLALEGGEIETAIKEAGKSDFVGGTAHGDMQELSAVFHLDGTEIDPTVAATYKGNTFRIQQLAQGYEEGTNLTVEWFKTWTTWQFTPHHGLEITQHMEFQRDAIIDSFYNCFLTIARNEDGNQNATTAQYGAQSPKYETVDLIARDHAQSYLTDVNRAIAWGGGISYEAEFVEGNYHQDPEHTEFAPNKNWMFFRNSASAYNKMYFNQGFTEIRNGAKIFNRYRYKINSSI